MTTDPDPDRHLLGRIDAREQAYKITRKAADVQALRPRQAHQPTVAPGTPSP